MSETRNEGRRVHIFGSGGVGFYAATCLCKMTDPHSITVYDPDDLGSSGLGHTRLPAASLGTKKADLLRGWLRVTWDCDPPTIVKELFTGLEVSAGDLVVDCSDAGMDEREKIWKRVRRKKARIVRVSYDGLNSTVVVAEGLPFVGKDRTGGYANVPSLALSFMAGGLGAEVVFNQLIRRENSNHIELQISLSDFCADWSGTAEAVAAD